MNKMRRLGFALAVLLAGPCVAAERFYFKDMQGPVPKPSATAARFADAERMTHGQFDPLAGKLLEAASTLTKSVYALPSLKLLQAATMQDARGDNLYAAWSFEEPFGSGVVVLQDTPYTSEFHFRLPGLKLASRPAVAAFWASLLAWGQGPLNLKDGDLSLWVAPEGELVHGFSGSFRQPRSEAAFVGDFFSFGNPGEDGWYLFIQLGKRYLVPGYPTAFVAERFPPLEELVKDWSFDHLYGEVGRWGGPDAFADFVVRRDRILLAELALRGLTADQVAALVAAKPYRNRYYSRVALVFDALRRAGKSDLAPYYAAVLKVYVPGNRRAEEAVETLFRQAQGNCSESLERVAVDNLKAEQFIRGSLGYLGRCARSAEAKQVLQSFDTHGDTGLEVLKRMPDRSTLAGPRKQSPK